VNAPIQQGSGNIQSVGMDADLLEALHRLVASVEQLIEAGSVPAEVASDLSADASTIDLQLRKAAPGRGIIQGAVASIEAVALAASGEAAYSGVIHALHALHAFGL
jgi:hypothetical protein